MEDLDPQQGQVTGDRGTHPSHEGRALFRSTLTFATKRGSRAQGSCALDAEGSSRAPRPNGSFHAGTEPQPAPGLGARFRVHLASIVLHLQVVQVEQDLAPNVL